MDFIIENELLKVTLKSEGASLKSVVYKEDNVEHIWEGNPEVWKGQAPILFPYAGRLKEKRYTFEGKEYTNCNPHGFARDFEHKFLSKTETEITFELTDSDETRAIWPFKFRLLSTFKLCGNKIEHTLRVENTDDRDISFGIGFHPGFAVPFDKNHTYKDYELKFEKTESPLCIETDENGLVSGKTYYLGKNIKTIPLTDTLFDNDSHCMTALNSNTFGLYEKDSGRAVVCTIKDFPYCLIWSMPGEPRFVCIEPWHSLPDESNTNFKWEEKPAAARIRPGESWSTTLRTAFVR